MPPPNCSSDWPAKTAARCSPPSCSTQILSPLSMRAILRASAPPHGGHADPPAVREGLAGLLVVPGDDALGPGLVARDVVERPGDAERVALVGGRDGVVRRRPLDPGGVGADLVDLAAVVGRGEGGGGQRERCEDECGEEELHDAPTAVAGPGLLSTRGHLAAPAARARRR